MPIKRRGCLVEAVAVEKTVVDEVVPRVAALMPAYNPDEIINRAVESLAKSTYPCDIYIVDDGSDIPITQTLAAFPRTKVIRLDRNRGVTHALNVGLRTILMQPYEFVARLDADDFSYPERIARQVEFLDRHPGIAAVGTWVRFTDEGTGRTLYISRTPDKPELVRKALHVNNVVAHPSLMIRTDVLKRVGLYSEQFPTAQDYELFRRIAQQFSIANISSVLVDQRLSCRGVQLTRRRRQLFDRFR